MHRWMDVAPLLLVLGLTGLGVVLSQAVAWIGTVLLDDPTAATR